MQCEIAAPTKGIKWVQSPQKGDLKVVITIGLEPMTSTMEASRADIQITQRLKEVAKLVGIELLYQIKRWILQFFIGGVVVNITPSTKNSDYLSGW